VVSVLVITAAMVELLRHIAGQLIPVVAALAGMLAAQMG
jgi:hypothetical protein